MSALYTLVVVFLAFGPAGEPQMHVERFPEPSMDRCRKAAQELDQMAMPNGSLIVRTRCIES